MKLINKYIDISKVGIFTYIFNSRYSIEGLTIVKGIEETNISRYKALISITVRINAI